MMDKGNLDFIFSRLRSHGRTALKRFTLTHRLLFYLTQNLRDNGNSPLRKLTKGAFWGGILGFKKISKH